MFKFFNKKSPADDSAEALAVQSYLAYLGSNPEISDDEMLELAISQNINTEIFWLVLGIVPMVATREILDDLGIEFSNNYQIYANDGSVIESGRLQDFPVYQATVSALAKLSDQTVLTSSATRGAEFNAINNALNSGSQAKDLTLSTVTLTSYEE